MDNKDILRMLREAGAKKLPGKKHEKWLLPNGRIYVRAHTPSDRNAYWNQAARLDRMLGRQPNETVEGAPSKKQYTKGPSRQKWSGMKKPFNALGEKLKEAGVVEDELRQEILDLQVALGAAQLEIEYHVKAASDQRERSLKYYTKASNYFLGLVVVSFIGVGLLFMLLVTMFL